MWTAAYPSVKPLFSGQGRICYESATYGAGRHVSSSRSSRRNSPYGAVPAKRNSAANRSKTSASSYAPDVHWGNLSLQENNYSGKILHKIPIFVKEIANRETESGVGGRYYLHPNEERICVSFCHNWLVFKKNIGLGTIHYTRYRILLALSQARSIKIWGSWDLQYWPGMPVYFGEMGVAA